MKIKSLVITFAVLCSAASVSTAAVFGGPKGGRLLEIGTHKAEFLVTKDRKVDWVLAGG